LLKCKYQVIRKIDESTFSDIFEVQYESNYLRKNKKTQKTFILKKIKENKGFFTQSLYEVYILSYLSRNKIQNKNNILHLFEFFY